MWHDGVLERRRVEDMIVTGAPAFYKDCKALNALSAAREDFEEMEKF